MAENLVDQTSLFNDEFDHIHRLRLAAESSLQRVQTEMVPLKRRLEELEREEASLQHQLNRCKTALALPNKLPIEVLRHIFNFCCFGGASFPPVDDGGVYTISRVCLKWRQIALATRELWSSIRMSVTRETERKIPIAHQWLSRANHTPISVIVFDGMTARQKEEYELYSTNIIQNLLSSYRFREMKVYIRIGQLEKLKGIIDGSIAVLEKLDLCCIGNHNGQSPSFHPAKLLPNLTSLRLSPFWDPRDLCAVASWNNIVHLSCDTDLQPSQFFNIMRQCHAIEFCELGIAGSDSSSDLDSAIPEIVLPHLRILDISIAMLSAKKLVLTLTTPRLTKLVLVERDDDLQLDIEFSELDGMFQRSGGMCGLENLAIGKTVVPLDPRAVLNCAPNLRDLQIDNGILSEETIHEISEGRVGCKLTDILLRSPHNADQILRMIEVRHQNVASTSSGYSQRSITPFQSVFINCIPDNIPGTEKRALRAGLRGRCKALLQTLGDFGTINLVDDCV